MEFSLARLIQIRLRWNLNLQVTNKIESHLFRIKNEIIPVFTSEVLKKEFIKNKLSGFSFLQTKVN